MYMYLLRFVNTTVYEPAHYDTPLIGFWNSSYLQHLNIKTSNVCKVTEYEVQKYASGMPKIYQPTSLRSHSAVALSYWQLCPPPTFPQ